MNRPRPARPIRQEEPYRVNERVRAPEVRLVGDNVENGIYPIAKALEMARALELDLVEIAPAAVPPVCRITEYSKFKYDQKRKQKEIKSKTKVVSVKEIRFGPNTDDHDFDFKLKHARGFLQEGSKVKAYVHFAGRSIVFKERGENLLNRFAQALDEEGKVEMAPKLEGKRMFLMLVPKMAKKAT